MNYVTCISVRVYWTEQMSLIRDGNGRRRAAELAPADQYNYNVTNCMYNAALGAATAP